MKSTFIAETGSRIVVEPSPMFNAVRVWIKGTDQIVSIPAELAAVVGQAIEVAARDMAGNYEAYRGQRMQNDAALAAAKAFGSGLSVVAK